MEPKQSRIYMNGIITDMSNRGKEFIPSTIQRHERVKEMMTSLLMPMTTEKTKK